MPSGAHGQSPLRERRLLLLTASRLGVATLLLGAILLLAGVANPSTWSFTTRALGGLFASAYAAALGVALWMRRNPDPALVARAQVAIDVLMATVLVYVTGGTSSGFTFLYGVSVLIAAMVDGAALSRIVGASSICLYLALSIGIHTGAIPYPNDQAQDAYILPPRELLFAATVNVLGLTLVTALSSTLASRISTAGGLLQAAEKSAAELGRLNEDIIRSLTSGLVTTDLSGSIRSINPVGRSMLRVGSDQEIIGRDVSTLLPLPELAHEHLRPGDTTRRETTARRQDGEEFPIGFSLTSLLSAEGVANGWIIVFQDLTEISHLRQQAERAERLAVLGRLAAGLAHEIRNPLSSIAGSVELVRDSSALSEEESRLLGIVLTECERLNELVSTMLQVGKPAEIRRAETDLTKIAAEVTAMAQANRAEAAGIQIQCRFDGVVTATVDEDQIRQVLWNLLKNAVQASPTGTQIEIRVEDAEANVVLSVSDEGRGIDPRQRERIFDMFYSERTHGAGIGLALVRQIVDAHGGTIEALDNEIRGVTFRVKLPKRTSSPSSAQAS